MKALKGTGLLVGVVLNAALLAGAQTPMGALAIDERQGDQYGWALDYETAGPAGQRALSECGSGCSVVLTFGRCAAYAADQENGSTAFGWAESYDSTTGARQRALAECGSRGGSSCIVRVWGCNGHVVEERLGLDQAGRQEIQEGLEAAGFEPGSADGLFGPRTRAAIRSWQTSQGIRVTGYLDRASVEALRPSAETLRPSAVRQPSRTASSSSPAASEPAPATAELEGLFWQSIVNSENPADFEAYLSQFPNGVFRVLAQNRLSALRPPANSAAASAPALTALPTASLTQQPPSPPASSEVEVVFWQSIVNSTNAADFEAFLRQFPNGVFAEMAQNRLSALATQARLEAQEAYRIGEEAYAKAEFSIAGEWFGKAAAIDPSWAIPMFGLGQVMLYYGCLENARTHFARAVELDPDSEMGEMAQGILSLLEGGIRLPGRHG